MLPLVAVDDDDQGARALTSKDFSG